MTGRFSAGCLALAASLLSAFAPAADGVWTKPKLVGGWKCHSQVKIEGNWLSVDVPMEGKTPSAAWAQTTIDLTEYDGQGFALEIDAADIDVDKPHGIKFMVSYTDQLWGQRWWLEPVRNESRLAKKHYDITVWVGMPRGKCTFTLGLQDAKGKIRFDLDSLRIRLIPVKQKMVQPGFKAEYSARVRNLPQLKGMMMNTQPTISEDDVKTLASWGGRLARYQICMACPKGKTEREDLAIWWKRFDEHLANLDKVLVWAKKYGLLVQVDLHVPPGRRYTKEDAPTPHVINDMKMFHVEKYAQEYLRAWRILARRYRGNRTVYGYDLINEPQEKPGGNAKYTFWELQDMAIRQIRQIDPDTPIIVSANWGGGPISFRSFAPFPYRDIIYQVHMYRPQTYTLQGWEMSAAKEGADNFYPNPAKGFDIEYLRRELKPVFDFERNFGAKINCGEWSCIMWAPGCERYLADCITIFDERKWDWAYGCIREWTAWSIEHDYRNVNGRRVMVPSADNPRKRVMLRGLGGQTGDLAPWYAGEKKPAREPMAVTLSFDDSTLDHYVYAVPALERHGYRGTFCLITAWVGTMDHGFQLTWDNVRDMKRRGHVIATHTHDHVNTGKLVKEGRADEVRRQLVVSRDRIREETGSAPEYFGAPFASFGPEVVKIAAEEGLVTMSDIRLNHGGGKNAFPSYGSDGNVGETIRAWYEKGVPGIDLVFHGLHPKLGVWRPFGDPAEFDRALDQVKDLERAGVIRVLGCKDFHDYMKSKGALACR